MKLKPLVFSIVFIIISLTSFWIIGSGFNKTSLNLDDWVDVVAAIGIFAVAFSLFALNNFENKKINLAVFGIVGALALISAPAFNLYIFGATIVLLVFLFFGEKRIKNSLLTSFKISFYDATGNGLKLVFEGLMILIIIFYYFAPAGEVFQRELTLPRPLYDTIFESVLKSFLGDKIGVVVGGDNLQNNFLASRESQYLLKQAADQTYTSFNETLRVLAIPYKKYIPLILAIAFYLSMRFVAIFIRLISNFFSWLIVKFMFLFGVMRKKKITIEREFYE